jgi:hypothetical protein
MGEGKQKRGDVFIFKKHFCFVFAHSKPRTHPSSMGWWLGLAPATLEFWVRFPSERRENRRTLF